MATITAVITIQTTIATLNGAALDALLAWYAQNITAKLPATSSAQLILTNITP